MSLYLGENKIADNTCSRNIGEIVASSIPLTDAGLHLLDGALISGAGSYAKFVTYIAGLVSTYPDLFETEANWQSSVSTYGVCGKFVYDSINNTVRLPKITGFTEGTIDPTVLGDLTEAGLPNITGAADVGGISGTSWGMSGQSYSGALSYMSASTTASYSTNTSSNKPSGISIDASRSSSIYGNSNTVQPQSIKVLYYIVIASSITNELNLDVADMATKSLDNLDNLGKNIANWSTNVTNCITEIPQDINLELNNGTLTLKAGSKVYVPNGVGVFDVVTIASDISADYSGWGTQKRLLTYNSTTNGLEAYELDTQTASGDTTPTISATFMTWYDTANNLIKYTGDSGSTWISGGSLPLAIFSGANSILYQAFNGFGYIGSTVFVLPNVKGLIPNGRNADGSLKNTEYTINSLITYTSGVNAYGYYFTDGNQIYWIALANEYYEQKNMPSGLPAADKYGLWYNPDTNIMLRSWNNEAWTKVNWTKIGNVNGTSNKITSLTPKTAFHALDYNDGSTISGWSMPSSRYIDLDWNTQTSYTLPANGMVVAIGRSSGTDCWFSSSIRDNNNTYMFSIEQRGATGTLLTWITPMLKKGWKISLDAHNLSTKEWFRFIYADGESV